jgi:hypothetical protein
MQTTQDKMQVILVVLLSIAITLLAYWVGFSVGSTTMHHAMMGEMSGEGCGMMMGEMHEHEDGALHEHTTDTATPVGDAMKMMDM